MYHYKIDLRKGKDDIWAHFVSDVRTHIRRTQRAGVTVVQEISERSVDFLYESMKRKYGEQGWRVSVSADYYRDLFELHDRLNLTLFAALYDGEIIGTLAHFADGKRFSSWEGGAKTGIRGLSVNDLIVWEAIQWAIDHGYQEYELIGANTPRLCEFKSKYSPDLNICFGSDDTLSTFG